MTDILASRNISFESWLIGALIFVMIIMLIVVIIESHKHHVMELVKAKIEVEATKAEVEFLRFRNYLNSEIEGVHSRIDRAIGNASSAANNVKNEAVGEIHTAEAEVKTAVAGIPSFKGLASAAKKL